MLSFEVCVCVCVYGICIYIYTYAYIYIYIYIYIGTRANGVQVPIHASGNLGFVHYKEVEAKIHSSGATRQAPLVSNVSVPSDGLQGRSRLEKPLHKWLDVTQQRREVDAKIKQVEAALDALQASDDDRASHSKKLPAELSASALEVVPRANPPCLEKCPGLIL